ncbi:hypothetical protein DICVIV_14283 [Dictyocaulus viviparus]|uniref:SCP domain-containing protein n=1 Tax=Dictyocaulus viviparus TaxID=29172 RepID=A0A0D8X5R5_DICVI|nr:hypothetical protein DICVIV_14283 [Dictyocaulus viviparus]
MPKLKYNCKIEASARNHARRCKFEPSEKATSKKLGENLAQLMLPKLDFVQAATKSVAMWFGELEKTGVGQLLKYTSSMASTRVRNYTQNQKITVNVNKDTFKQWGSKEVTKTLAVSIEL